MYAGIKPEPIAKIAVLNRESSVSVAASEVESFIRIWIAWVLNAQGEFDSQPDFEEMCTAMSTELLLNFDTEVCTEPIY